MKEYSLPYGSGEQKVMLPEEHILYDIHGNKAAVAGDIKAATLEALRNPIESAPLKDVVKAGDKVAVIVSDITRLVRTADFLPVVIDEINAGGVPDSDITIVVATYRTATLPLLWQPARTAPTRRKKTLWFAAPVL